jgi:hypothetical protein
MRSITMLACLCVALAGPVRAQTAASHDGVDVDQVWRTASGATRTEDVQRAQILRVLNHPLTQEVARQYGLDLDAAKCAVPALSGSELQQLSQRAALAESALSGGDTLVISTTVVIIVLLIIILILVA